MPGCFRSAMFMVMALCVLAGVSACVPKAKTTRLTQRDMDEVVNKMAMSLAASDFIQSRNAQSPPAYIMIDKVQNLSTDRIPVSEQWALVARVRSQLPLNEWANNKNLYFLITPERHSEARKGGFDGSFGPGAKADFLMSADFLSARRAAAGENDEGLVDVMAEQYYMEYALTDLDRRKILWSDKFEVKREAKGLLID